MHAYTYSQHTDTLKLPRGESLLLCIKKKLAPLFEQPSLLWSDPVGARRRRAKALRRRAPPHVPISIQTTERGVHSIQTMPPARSLHPRICNSQSNSLRIVVVHYPRLFRLRRTSC